MPCAKCNRAAAVSTTVDGEPLNLCQRHAHRRHVRRAVDATGQLTRWNNR